MTIDEKIRRAEEIYYRRRELEGQSEYRKEGPKLEDIASRENKKKDIKLFKKMIMQIFICLTIYSVFYLIVNNNYVFSEDFTNKAREILSQDINFSHIYSLVSNRVNEIFSYKQIQEELEEKEEENKEENMQENIQNNDENIGGAEEILTNQEQIVENNEANPTDTMGTDELEEDNKNIQPTSKLTQMEQDANYIKSKISFIKPLEGTISSAYGERNPTTPTVPKNHTGTDIAAEIGSKIVSATNGTVILASSQGDYGKHLKIETDNVIIVYAHCNKLYVKEGDVITQGQEIAEVGNTGNTTGPHLHFEVRYQNRYVNPQLILEL